MKSKKPMLVDTRRFRKLSLSKETLKHLDSAALHGIAGGTTVDLDGAGAWTWDRSPSCFTCLTCLSGAPVCCA